MKENKERKEEKEKSIRRLFEFVFCLENKNGLIMAMKMSQKSGPKNHSFPPSPPQND